MKKLFITLFTSISLLFSGCSESLLDLTNENTLSVDQYWESEEDVQKGVIAIYNMFYRQGTWTRNIYTQMNGMADDGVSFAGWTELQEWTKFVFTDYNFGEVNIKIWSEHYKAIFRANQVLDHVDDVPFKKESDRLDCKGQAKFLRAFYYFYLAILYEDVPLVTKTSTVQDRPEQKTVAEIWKFIEDDLNEIIDNDYLPARRNGANLGRVTKGAAYALLSKVYMQQHKWEEAKDALYWIVEGEGKDIYSLVNDYEHNFRADTENNSESIYEIQFSQTIDTHFDVDFDPNSNLGSQIAMNQAPVSAHGWQNIQARRWLVDYFKREKTVTGENDPRLFYSVWYDKSGQDFSHRADTLVYGRTWANEPSWGNQVFIKKYSSKLEGETTEFYWHDINFRLFRLADFYLLYAEALNELGSTPSADAIKYMNKVRNRAGLANIENSSFYNGGRITSDKAAFREQLKIERGLELNFECVRWIDLKRWGIDKTETVEALKALDADFGNYVVGQSYRMPIPQSEVDMNPNLEQNYPY